MIPEEDELMIRQAIRPPGCLRYVVASRSEAVIVDPLRHIDEYLRWIKDKGLKVAPCWIPTSTPIASAGTPLAARLGVGGIHPVDVLPPQIPLKWGNPTGIHRGFRPGEGPRIPGHTAGNIPIWSMSANRRFHVNIWYSYDGNTKTDVAKETIRYVERVPLSYYDRNVR